MLAPFIPSEENPAVGTRLAEGSIGLSGMGFLPLSRDTSSLAFIKVIAFTTHNVNMGPG